MTLGILVNTDRHLDHLVGLTKAALVSGHEVDIFVMDTGTRLLPEHSVQELARLKGVAISFCLLSAKKSGIVVEEIPSEIIAGSQMNNLNMNHRADKVIVL